jgi:hypothetical protein
MMDKNWFKENSTLIYFLIAQMLAIGAGAASILAYSVKLETRVHIMETRGAEYSVARMARMEEKITVLQQQIMQNQETIRLIREHYLKDRDNK